MRVAIDSSLSMYATVPGTNLTVLADSTAWLGRAPDFVIRPTGTGGAGATPVTSGEIAQLHAEGIGVTPYYNDSPLNANGFIPNGDLYAQGQRDAANAVQQADAIGFPGNVYLPGDIESNAPVTEAWVRGWCDEMRGAKFAGSGMLYGILGYDGNVRGNLGQAVEDALAKDTTGNVHRLLLWPADWIFKAGINYSLAATQPWNVLAGTDLFSMIRLWQLSGNDFNGIADEDICQDDFYNTGVFLPGGGVVTVSAGLPIGTVNPQAKALFVQAQASLNQGVALLG